MDYIRLTPTQDYVLIKEDKADDMINGIILPDEAKQKHNSGTVIVKGPDVSDDISIDDKVLYGEYAGTEVVKDDIKYLLVRESEVMAILVDE